MGLRQTFGLFFSAFEQDLNCTRTEFGLAIGIQMLFWGFFAPLFGIIADKYGGNKAVFIGFIIFGLGIYVFWARLGVGGGPCVRAVADMRHEVLQRPPPKTALAAAEYHAP